MAGVLGDDGSITNMPWSPVFDYANNARALSAIQAEGFRAASKLVDRFAAGVPGSVNGAEAPSNTGVANVANGNGASGPGTAEFESLMKFWWSLTGRFLLGQWGRPPLAGAATLDMGKASGTGVLQLQVDASGHAANEVWLHNSGAEDLAEVRLRCSDLLAHDGSLIGSSAVQADPHIVPMPRRSTRGITVNAVVPPGARAALYRGTLLAGGHPDLWLPVVLHVRA